MNSKLVAVFFHLLAAVFYKELPTAVSQMQCQLEDTNQRLFNIFFLFIYLFIIYLFLSFVLLGLHLQHTEVPQARDLIGAVAAEAIVTAIATSDPSQVCDLHHSSWQPQILNPLSEARDRTRNLIVPSRIRFCCATMGTPPSIRLYIRALI